jgi:predicted transcriptional regulator
MNRPWRTSWNELREQILTKEEIEDKVRLVGALIEARREQEMSQQKLGEAVGVRQPFIANIENGKKDPSFSMLMKILRALGKTLAVVDIKKSKTA